MKRTKRKSLMITAAVLVTALATLFGLFADLIGFTGPVPDMDTVDASTLQAIKEAYVAAVDPSASPDRVAVAEYCGTYGDCTVLMLTGVLYYTQGIRAETVGGIRFHYNDGNTLYAYCDGAVVPLKEAYERGFLSRWAVRRARDAHNAYLRGCMTP